VRYLALSLAGLLAALLLPAPAVAASDRRAAVDALEQVQALAGGKGVRTGRELTPALAKLAALRAELGPEDRREATALLARPTDDPDPTAPKDFGLQPYHSPTTRSCSDHFCVHWVDDTTDNDAPPGADGNPATIPPYIEFMKTAFETSYSVENVRLGWRTPVPDGRLGGDNRTDVYVKDIGDKNLFGYASTDPQPAGRSQFAYVVMDDDYAFEEFKYLDPQDPLEVTAAHEYNHVLQYAYDAFQDAWMFEATATWMEDKVYSGINDYLLYLPSWVRLSTLSMTRSDPDKIYGSAVWNHWLEARFRTPDVIRRAWEVSESFSSASAYNLAIAEAGGLGFEPEFVDFAASTAGWRVTGSGFPEGSLYPEMTPAGSLATNGAAITGALDNTAYALYQVPSSSASELKLSGSLPPGTAGGIALIGLDGAMTKVVGRLDSGGSTTVTLPAPGRFSRITAAVVNANRGSRNGQPFSLAVSDGTVPTPTPTPTPSPTATPIPTPTPTPTPTATAASLRLSRGTLPRLRTLARRGVLPFSARVNKAGRLTARATVDRATARRLRVGRFTTRIGTGRRTATGAGRFTLKVKLTRRARAGFKRQRRTLRVKVRTTFVPAGGGKAVSRTITLLLRP